MSDELPYIPCPWVDEDDETDEHEQLTCTEALDAVAPAHLSTRAARILHGWDGDPPLCPMCLLSAIALFASAPGADARSIVERLGEVLYEQAGPVVSIAFEALAFPGDAGRRARFEELAVLLADPPAAERPGLGPASPPVH